MKGINTLMERLHWKGGRTKLESLARSNKNYKTWTEDDGRKVQAAKPILRRLQARIAVLLRRVVPPSYRQSGVRGRSFLTNAASHLGDHPAIKFDIRKFYPSTTFSHVKKLFKSELKCSGDVAYLLASLSCYRRQHLPTGGVHSEVVAFYSHKSILDEFEKRIRLREGKFTIYVDDGMATVPNASHSDLDWLRTRFARSGVVLHPSKSMLIGKGKIRTLTGVQITRGEMRAPPRQHQKVKERFKQLGEAGKKSDAVTNARSLLGHLDHIAHIESRFLEKAAGNRARLKNLISER